MHTLEKVIKHDKTNSVLIKVNEKLSVWFDIWIDNNRDLNGDWNQYIFNLNDENDLAVQTYQSDCCNFETCFNLAEEYLTKKGILKYENGSYSLKQIPMYTIQITWCTDDVLKQAEEEGIILTLEQCKEVLDHVDKNHDATIGINWDVISEGINYIINS